MFVSERTRCIESVGQDGLISGGIGTGASTVYGGVTGGPVGALGGFMVGAGSSLLGTQVVAMIRC
jgi:hypothetical protein